MLGLPSTTQVERAIPKTAFYRHLELSAKQKDEFVHLIERISIANSVKAATLHVPPGKVEEIVVLRVELKTLAVPHEALEIIAKQIPHTLVFVLEANNRQAVCVMRESRMWLTDWLVCDSADMPRFCGATLDTMWENMCAQVIFGRTGIDVAQEIARNAESTKLEQRILAVAAKHGKETQAHKRNALYKELQELKQQKAALGEGLPWRN